MIKVKSTVRLSTKIFSRNEIARIPLAVFESVPETYEPTITSGLDGKHKNGSKHYAGEALDFRTRDFPTNVKLIAKIIQRKLGEDYDVVVEKDHIHIEWDPK